MIEHVQFLAHLPVRAMLDGELVAFDADGRPDSRLCVMRYSTGTVPSR
jgi:hypothetical protein